MKIINDVKILEDTKTRAEKEKKEQDNKPNTCDPELSVYWDDKCKGWYIKNTCLFICAYRKEKENRRLSANKIYPIKNLLKKQKRATL